MMRKSAVRWAAWALTAFVLTTFLATVGGLVASIAYTTPDSAFVSGEDKMWSGVGAAISVLGVSVLFGLVIALVPSWKISSGICAGLGLAIAALSLLESDRRGIPGGLGVAGAGIAAALVPQPSPRGFSLTVFSKCSRSCAGLTNESFALSSPSSSPE